MTWSPTTRATATRRRASRSTRTIARYGENGAYRIALVYAWRGEVDDAVTWLARGQERRSARVVLEIALHPIFARLHDHPRYVRVLRKMNLPATGP